MELAWTGIAAILIAIVVGFGARLILPGRQRIGVASTVFIGFIGALVGAGIAEAFGLRHTDGVDWIKLILQFGLAVVMIGVYSGYFFMQHRD